MSDKDIESEIQLTNTIFVSGKDRDLIKHVMKSNYKLLPDTVKFF